MSYLTSYLRVKSVLKKWCGREISDGLDAWPSSKSKTYQGKPRRAQETGKFVEKLLLKESNISFLDFHWIDQLFHVDISFYLEDFICNIIQAIITWNTFKQEKIFWNVAEFDSAKRPTPWKAEIKGIMESRLVLIQTQVEI